MKRIEFKSKHSRWRRSLPLLGLFIVFLTFAVKDGVKDWRKDAVDSANAARTMFLLRSDIGGVHEDIGTLSDIVRDQLATSNRAGS
jgi:hypothetical protein